MQQQTHPRAGFESSPEPRHCTCGLCSEQDVAVAHYSLGNLSNQMLAREYQLTLPDEANLERRELINSAPGIRLTGALRTPWADVEIRSERIVSGRRRMLEDHRQLSTMRQVIVHHHQDRQRSRVYD